MKNLNLIKASILSFIQLIFGVVRVEISIFCFFFFFFFFQSFEKITRRQYVLLGVRGAYHIHICTNFCVTSCRVESIG